MKKTIYVVIILAILVGLYFIIFNQKTEDLTIDNPSDVATSTATTTPTSTSTVNVLPEEVETAPAEKAIKNIGVSVEGNDIVAYSFGTGSDEILVVAGIHGTFAPSAVKTAEELVAYYNEKVSTLPENIRLTIIPTLNPDGLEGNTRTNANNVDLNRNFDCAWKADAQYSGGPVSGGSKVFSEPEAQAIRDYVTNNNVVAAVILVAREGKVYAESCNSVKASATNRLATDFSQASGYALSVNEAISGYVPTGELASWLNKIDIPAISVLLSDYNKSEFSQNQLGLRAVINYFAN